MNPPTPQQIVERNELLAVALESNPKKATKHMRDEHGGRCCLCVARDVAKEHGCVLPDKEPAQIPEYEVAEWFGWKNKAGDPVQDPYLKHPDYDKPQKAAVWNDGENGVLQTPHKIIANMFRDKYCTKK